MGGSVGSRHRNNRRTKKKHKKGGGYSDKDVQNTVETTGGEKMRMNKVH